MEENLNENNFIEPEFLPTQTRYSPIPFALISLVVILISYQIIGGGLALFAAGFRNPDTAILRAATMGAQIIFLLLPTLWLLKRQHGRFELALPFRTPSFREFILSTAALFALLQILDGYMYFQAMIPVSPELQKIIDMFKKMIEEGYRQLVAAESPVELLYVLAVISITPAICEEILFRGLVQKNFSLAMTPTKSFLLTGIIFGLYHFNPFQVVPLIAIGIFLSLLRFRSNTLVLPMTMHFFNNTLSVAGVYLYGFDEAADSSSLGLPNDTPGSVFSKIIFFGIIFSVTVWYYYKTTETLHEKNEPFGKFGSR